MPTPEDTLRAQIAGLRAEKAELVEALDWLVTVADDINVVPSELAEEVERCRAALARARATDHENDTGRE